MKILYVTQPYFLDSDILLLEQLQKKSDTHILFNITKGSLKSTLADISKCPNKTGIYSLEDFEGIEFAKDKLDVSKLKIIYRNSESFTSFETLKSINLFTKYVKDLKPDLIHIIGIQSFDFLRFLPFCKIPIVQTLHDPVPHSSDVSLKNSLQRWMNDFFIKNKIILNRVQLSEFIKLSKPKNVLVSRIGPYEYMQDYLAQKSTNGSDKKIILFFGRIEKYKGVDYLIKAFNQICKKYPDAKLLIAGRGNLYWDKTLHENNEQIEIVNKFLSMEDIANYISSSCCVVCPYTDATQSGVLMTAFGLKTPIMASAVGAFPDVIQNGFNGYLFPPKDVDALANVLDNYLSDKTLYETFSRNIGESYFSGNNSWGIIVDEVLDFYKKILS